GGGGQIADQAVPDQRRLRLHGAARFRAPLPDARTDPAGRCPGASVRRGHGGRDARAKRRSEHVPVEGAQGADSPGGAPDAFLPPSTSPCFCLETFRLKQLFVTWRNKSVLLKWTADGGRLVGHSEVSVEQLRGWRISHRLWVAVCSCEPLPSQKERNLSVR